MGKKARHANHLPAVADLQDMPGTRVMFWVVPECPYCGEKHLHLAGNLRTADPSETLGEQPAPCNPEKGYVLTLAPRKERKKGKSKRRQGWREPDWEDEL